MTEFETIDYQQKRLRLEGKREWKLWYSEEDDGLAFRILTKDASIGCYETLSAKAKEVTGDLVVKEDENDEAYFTDMFCYETEDGALYFYLESGDRDLVWVEASGCFAKEGCSFHLEAPMMPEVAG